MKLNNYTMILVLSYLDISTLNKIKKINSRFVNFFISKLYINLIKDSYKIEDTDIENKLLNILLVMDNKCLCCKKSMNGDKIIILNNILYSSGICILCFQNDCECYLYPYFHYNCIKNFELPSLLYKVYRKFCIPYLINKNVDGLFIRNRNR